jgi:signal transduction histidine kinase
MWSLSARLLRYMVSGQMLVLLFMLLAAGIALNIAAQDYFKSRLEHDRDLLLNELSWTGPVPEIEHEHLTPVFNQPFSGHYFQINSDDDLLLSVSLQGIRLHDEHIHDVKEGEPQWHWQPFENNQYLYVLSQTLKQGERHLHVQVGEDFQPIINAFLHAFFWLAGLFSLLLTGLFLWQRRLLMRTLKPFSQISNQLKQLAQQDIDQLPPPDMQELTGLVNEINALGERTRERLNRARLASGNLSHSLKTPLAILANRLSNMQEQNGDTEQQDLTEARELVERMGQQIDNEMKRARIAGLMSRAPKIELNEMFDQLLLTLKKLYPHIQLQCHMAAAIRYPGDREDIIELFGNLLDNACKWAQTAVDVDIGVADHQLRVCISDDGPGIAEEKIPGLINPGERLDESVKGYGLGLAIVSDIVAQYQGRLQLKNRPLNNGRGGLQVTVTLPY